METALGVIGMGVQIVTLKMGMAKRQAMTGMEAQEGGAIGMEVEVESHHAMREEATGIGP